MALLHRDTFFKLVVCGYSIDSLDKRKYRARHPAAEVEWRLASKGMKF